MQRILDFLGLAGMKLKGLDPILQRVADGELSTRDAAQQIRGLSDRFPSPIAPRTISIMLLCIGPVFFLAGVAFTVSSQLFVSSAVEIQGEVVEMATGSNGSAPVVRYEVNGTNYQFQSSLWSSPPRNFVGEKVRVLYQPNDPKNGQIKSFIEQWLFPVTFMAAGFSSTLIGAVWLWFQLRRQVATNP